MTAMALLPSVLFCFLRLCQAVKGGASTRLVCFGTELHTQTDWDDIYKALAQVLGGGERRSWRNSVLGVVLPTNKSVSGRSQTRIVFAKT